MKNYNKILCIILVHHHGRHLGVLPISSAKIYWKMCRHPNPVLLRQGLGALQNSTAGHQPPVTGGFRGRPVVEFQQPLSICIEKYRRTCIAYLHHHSLLDAGSAPCKVRHTLVLLAEAGNSLTLGSTVFSPGMRPGIAIPLVSA